MSDAAWGGDTITISERHQAEARARSADVLVRLSETGRGATTPGRVSTLREALVARGFAEDDVLLEGIESGSWTWAPVVLAFVAPIVLLFSTHHLAASLGAGAAFVLLAIALSAAKIGTITARLRIRCADADRTRAAIDAALSLGGIEVQAVEWRYEVDEESRADWAVKAIAQANQRAARVAEALGVHVVGVRSYREEHVEPPPSPPNMPAPVEAHVARKTQVPTSIGESLGPAIANVARAGVAVTIEYKIAGGPASA